MKTGCCLPSQHRRRHRVTRLVAAPKKDTRSRALLAYGLAISGIIGAIAYRKTPGNGVGE